MKRRTDALKKIHPTQETKKTQRLKQMTTATTKQNSASIDFIFNNKCKGTVVVNTLAELKEFILAPEVHRVEGFSISLAQEKMWSALESAGLTEQCSSRFHLYCWLECPYKIPLDVQIPLTAEEQAVAFEHFDKYY